jgi:hypothetical protein
MAQKVFISYAREDSAEATAIADVLRREGFVVYRDQDFLRAGQFGEQLDAAIAGSDVFVLLISRSAVRSTYVTRELHVAADEHLRPVLPVMLEDTDVAPFRLAIAGLQRVDLGQGTAAQFADLVDGVYRSAALGRRHGPTNERRALKVFGTVLSTIGLIVIIAGFGSFFLLLASAWNSSPGDGPPAEIPYAFIGIFAGMVVAGSGAALRKAARRT